VGEVKEQYQVTIKNRVSVLENLEDNGDINRAWDAIRENIKLLPKSVSVIVKQRVINHGLIRNVQNWLIEGGRLNYSGCRTQV
jgi:ABC-type cobalamin transport system ATPase subunit